MRLTAQLTSLERNPVEYFASTGPEILDDENFEGLDEVEYALEDMGFDEAGNPTRIPVRH
jgi:hypothetical protein